MTNTLTKTQLDAKRNQEVKQQLAIEHPLAEGEAYYFINFSLIGTGLRILKELNTRNYKIVYNQNGLIVIIKPDSESHTELISIIEIAKEQIDIDKDRESEMGKVIFKIRYQQEETGNLLLKYFRSNLMSDVEVLQNTFGLMIVKFNQDKESAIEQDLLAIMKGEK